MNQFAVTPAALTTGPHLSRSTRINLPKSSGVPRAQVRLARGSEAIGNTSSDAFGDFRFDALTPSSDRYRVEVTADGYRGQVWNSNWPIATGSEKSGSTQ